MQLRVLSRDDLHGLLDMPSAIAAMRSAFEQLSDGRAQIPVRAAVEGPVATLLAMPGRLEVPQALGAKLVAVAPHNRREGLPAIHAAVVLLDALSGVPRAVMEGSWLTALRTGAASGLATELLARRDARVLAVVGAGAQARFQVDAVRAVRSVEEVRIHSRGGRSARALASELHDVRVEVAETADDAVRGADVVVTVTDSRAPVVSNDAVTPGTHLNAVGGYRRDMQELPTSLMARARVVVDQVAAALAEAGDVVIPLEAGVLDTAELVELGAVAAGAAPGRRHVDEITVFKSVGSAAQDLAVAALALERATTAGVGTLVEL